MLKLKQRILFFPKALLQVIICYLANTTTSSKTPKDLACKVVDEYRDREKESLI